MTTQRRSYETGHRPKCLVVVDDTAEWDRASTCEPLGAPGRRRRRDAAHHRDRDQNQQWLGVAESCARKRRKRANVALDRACGRANASPPSTPERVIREGDPTEQILDVHRPGRRYRDAGAGGQSRPEGPGPLIAMLAARSARSRFRSPSYPATSVTRRSTRCRERCGNSRF